MILKNHNQKRAGGTIMGRSYFSYTDVLKMCELVKEKQNCPHPR